MYYLFIACFIFSALWMLWFFVEKAIDPVSAAASNAVGMVTDNVLPIIVLFVLPSIVAFAIYGFDKYAALRDRRRVPEKTLHVIAILGGWPGALVAQHIFRHKTVKQPFRNIFWATVTLNCLATFLIAATIQHLRLAGG